MTDHSELRRLAEAAASSESEQQWAAFKDEMTPETVLALLAENERLETVSDNLGRGLLAEIEKTCAAGFDVLGLKAEVKHLTAVAYALKGGTVVELSQKAWALDADNHALRKALGDLLALYEGDEGCRKLPQYIAARAAMTLEPRP